jgi:4-alpha-glucanotransferase
MRDRFDAFARENASWLDDYALYRAIKMSQDQRAWQEWDEPLKRRDEEALSEAEQDLTERILEEKFYQFLFFKQWWALKEYANSNGVKIVGDVPIFLAHDSSDVWRHQRQFKLNDDGSPKVVSGVPPDYFSRTGQLWGNPIYDWDAMREDGFSWWIERIRQTRTLVDIVRIDHFRGFHGAWEVPGGQPTAEHGQWVDAPGRELFHSLRSALGDLPFWVEDLGFVTPEVEALRDEFSFPGMRILQFAFGGDPQNQALPHNYVRNCVAYTGTHDNDTVVGWWNAQLADSQTREFCLNYLDTDGAEIHWDLIRAIWASVADSSIVPLQDLLGLDNGSRMNLPATTDGNWQWRFKSGDLTAEIMTRLRELTEVYGR